MPLRLSIVVPAYNEQDRLPPMLDAYLPYFDEHLPGEYELIISVNGSSDATESIARSYIPAHPALRVTATPDPIGKGGAIIRGGRLATGRFVGFTDADGSTPPSAFHELLLAAESDPPPGGLVIASRWLPGAHVSPRQPLKRRIASRIFNALVRLLFHLRVTDTQCGAKVMPADAWHAIVPSIGLTRWAFDVDMLFKTRRAHIPIREIPTTWHDVDGSKLRVVRASFQMFLAIVRLRLLHSRLRFVVTAYDRIIGRFVTLPPYAP
jgi:dolichyl-phosphate beta-glucosyltransferase